MCGVTFSEPFPRGSLGGGFRRVASVSDLHHDCSEPGGLKPSKSAIDLSRVVEKLQVVAELAALKLGDRHSKSWSASTSAQSSGNDTARSSPTSGYEQLVRSWSPSAVLFSEDNAATCAPLKPQHEREAATPTSQLSRQPPTAWDAGLLPGDHPFLELAANFNLVEVPSAVVGAPRRKPLPSSSSSLPTRHGPLAAAVAGAGVDVADDPICDAAATQCARAAATAAADVAAHASPSAAYPTGSAPILALAASVPSPFARPALQMQTHPSLISHSPPDAQHLLPSVGGGQRSGSGSPTSGSQHSCSGSLVAEMREHSMAMSRRGSIDCTVGHSSHLSEGHAAEELFYRLNHARQTVDFVKRQAHSFSALNKADMDVWEALEALNTLREYESALLGDPDATPEMPLLEHALQCAEACRTAFPYEDYMHLVGLLSPLGKLLAHAKFGAEPQFAICGETFPVGCRFHPAICYSQYFCANPDRRKRLYNSPTGVYRQGCGLGGVLMSWGAGEYLHLVLRLNGALLPPEALFCLRHQNLRCVFRQGRPYSELLSEFDRVQLPRLARFQQLCAYQRMPRAKPLLVPQPGAAAACGSAALPLRVAPELRAYYDSLLAKYIPQGTLLW